jgi:hypothetical protein
MLYQPGALKFDQTKIDQENIPELARFFTPRLNELDVLCVRDSVASVFSGKLSDRF